MKTSSLPLETDRLIIRRYEERDVADILDYSRHAPSDEHRRRNVDWELSEEGVASWWEPMKTMEVDEAKSWLGLLIEVKDLGRVIGNTGFNIKTIQGHRQGMIGWIIGESYEGNGYMTEAVTALLDYLFLAEEFHRTYAMTSPDNTRSWRLMERLGMRREAHFIKNSYHDSGWTDEYVYAILAAEWRERRRQ